MPLMRAYALPHPPLAVPGIGDSEKPRIQRTLKSFDVVAREVAALAPETIIFITPHNVLYSDYFHISPGKSAKGDFSRFGAGKICFKAEYDTKLAGKIADISEQKGIHAGTLGERSAALDHGVMVPMWFINQHYTNYKIVRICQSGMEPSEHYRLGQIIAEAAADTKAVLVASGDLSHKLAADGPYGFAPAGPEFDAAIQNVFATGNFLSLFGFSESLRESAAECGYNSFMVLAGCLDRQAVTAKLHSYEGPYGVGYAVAGFAPGGPDASRDFLEQFNKISLQKAREYRGAEDEYRALARKSLEYTIQNGRDLPLPGGLPEEMLNKRAGAFVSLHKNGHLRGCVGTIAPTTDCIASEIIQNAVSAGLRDNRFETVGASELPFLTYKVDILSPPEPISGILELDVKRYGVIVSSGHKRGLLLPNLDGIDTVEQQVSIARHKAGIPQNAAVKLERFEVVRHE